MKPTIVIREQEHDSTIIGRAINILKIFNMEKMTNFIGDVAKKKNVKKVLPDYFEVKIKKAKGN